MKMMESYGRQEERRQQKAMRDAELAKAALLEAEASKATVMAWSSSSTNKLPQSTSLEASSVHDNEILKLLPDFHKLKHGHGSVPTFNGHAPRKTLDEADASQARREDKRIRELATSSMRRSSSDQLLNGHAHAQNGSSKPNMFSQYLKNPQNKIGQLEEPRKNGLNGHNRSSKHDTREDEPSNDVPALHELKQMIREITSMSASNPELITPLNSPICMRSTRLSSQSRSPSPVETSQAAGQVEDDLALSESSEDEEGEIETSIPPPDEHLRSDQSASSGIGSDPQAMSNTESVDHHTEPTSDEDQGFNFNLHEWHQKINDKLTPVNRETPSPVVRPASAVSGHNPLTPATGKALTSSERSAKSVYDETSNSSPQSPMPEIQLHSVPALPMSPPPPSPRLPSPERTFEEEQQEDQVEETGYNQKRISLKPRAKRKDGNARNDFTVTFTLSMIDRLPSLSKYGHKINEQKTSKNKVEKSKKRNGPKQSSSSNLANEVLRDAIRTVDKEMTSEPKKTEEVKKQPIKIKLRKPTVTSPSDLFSHTTTSQPSPADITEPSTFPEPVEGLKVSSEVTTKSNNVEKTKDSKKRKSSVDEGRKKKENALGGLFTPDIPSPKPEKSKAKKNEENGGKRNGKKEKTGKIAAGLSVPSAEANRRRTPSPLSNDLGMPSPLHIPASAQHMPSPLNLSVTGGSASQRMPSPLIVDRLEGSTSPADEPDSSLPVDLSFSRRETEAIAVAEEVVPTKEPRKEKARYPDVKQRKESPLNDAIEEENAEPVNEVEDVREKEQQRKRDEQEKQHKEREEKEKAEKLERERLEKKRQEELEREKLSLSHSKAEPPAEKEKSKDKERKSGRSSHNKSGRDSEEERDRRRSSRDRERGQRRKRERSRSRDRRSRSRSRDVRRRKESSPSEKAGKASSRKRSREDEDDAKVVASDTSKKTEIIKPKKPSVSSESVLDNLMMADRRIPSPDQKEDESTKKPPVEKNASSKTVKEAEKTKEEAPITTVTNGNDDGASQTAKWDVEHAALKPLDMRLDQEHQKMLGKIFKDEAGLLSQSDKTQMDMRAVLFLQSVVHFVLMARAMEKVSPANSRSLYDATVLFSNQPINKEPATLLMKMTRVLQLRTQAIFSLKSFKLIEDKVVTAQRSCEKFKKMSNAEAARARTPAQAKVSTGAVNGKSPGSPGKVASPFSVGSSGSQGSADMPRSSQVPPSTESPVSAVSTVPTSNEVTLPSSYRDHYDLTQPLHHAWNMWRRSNHTLEDFRKLNPQVGQFDTWLQGKAPLTFDSSIEQLSLHLYVALWVLRKLG
ncbi:hypothetical protein RvY_11218 [Ramazzottius varieornatus]|uniref:AF4/FMR2 C-terminal homology domain-containing protein n=1 Tax=Ramazzottius varieornatus TaxID=947166 RepID=A0A1D1VFD6_RAMVA|nr:hypothetical protein RvY_11218 [Ramazzottius varieornatus]